MLCYSITAAIIFSTLPKKLKKDYQLTSGGIEASTTQVGGTTTEEYCEKPEQMMQKEQPVTAQIIFSTVKTYKQLGYHNYICGMNILMVCLGNICRSPLAEGILQSKANDAGLNWIVQSAGTNGLHVGEAPHHLSQKIAKFNGIDISKQTARKFEATDFEAFDKIYVMAEDVMDDVRKISGKYFDENKVVYFLNELHPGKNENVPDPWYGSEDGYTIVYGLINKTCDAIIEKEAINKN